MFSIINIDEGSPAAAVDKAICLPQHLLKKWVASTAPNLNLQGKTLTPAHWSRLAVCIAQTNPGDISSLQMSAVTSSLVADLRPPAIQPEALRSLSDSLSLNFKHMLGAIEGAMSHMTHLQHLDLHDLRLTPLMIPALEQLLGNLPTSVTQLTLSTVSPHLVEFGGVHKLLFFRAVSRIHSLQELHMREWQQFVGSDATVCAEPLQSMPGLRIFVPRVRESPAFPPGLTFVSPQGT